MKILKIFGAVVAAHLLAFIIIFANPGCSSSKSTPPAFGTNLKPAPERDAIVPVAGVPPDFDPDAPAVPAGRYSPTRPASAPTNQPNANVMPPVSVNPGAPTAPTTPAAAAAATAAAEAAAAATASTNYTTVLGDNLWTLAQRNGIRVQDLAAANGLSPNAQLKLGQKLIIPPPRPTPAAKAGPAPAPAAEATKAGGGVIHQVKSGENLSTIAQRYGVRSADIVRENNIPDPGNIRAGTNLRIPGGSGWQNVGGGQTPAPKTGPAPTPAPVPNPGPPPSINTSPNAAPAGGDIPMIRIGP